ncbi:signal peptidase II [Microbaculum marinisediminis]|uniref:Lipoprotein signal peptidase n=1 Tax=Microbaculum marinisediminis TaxID=2931392 RepID=A0AAW5QQP3_9HYPH|nr:signal peptidase II [Microbaculum sp. A6E488]MCT8970391.1 signal peptidase II [Microbaculum sp. A6E488]
MSLRRTLWGPLTGLGASVALVVFLLDRLHKWAMLGPIDIAARGRIEVAPFFDLILVWNRGVSYGLFQQDTEAGRWVLVAVKIVASLALWIWLARAHSRLTAVSIGLVIGGAIGNAVDRAIYGAVADFFHFSAFGWSWYVFNLADVAIVAGVVGLLYDSLTDSHKTAPKPD